MLRPATALIVGLAIGFDAAVFLPPLFRSPPPPPPPATGISASSYALGLTSWTAPLDVGAGGAIAALGDEMLLITRTGGFHRLDRAGGGFVPVDLAPPLDIAPQEALLSRPVQRLSFGYKDMLLRPAPDAPGQVEILLSHTVADAECVALAISRGRAPAAALRDGGAPAWQELWRSAPCIPLGDAFVLQTGGAMDWAQGGGVHVFVGDFGLDDFNRPAHGAGPQAPGSDVGKVVDVAADGAATVRSAGHRNPGGLIATPAGEVYVVEHGPRGGDELNLSRPGQDYGWPQETYGTHYGALTWPLDDTPGRITRFAPPVYAWVPSIAVSGLARLRGPEFASWEGDLLVASLRGAAVHRLRMRDGRVVIDEPLPIGARIRDMAVDDGGRIWLKLDTEARVIEIFDANEGREEVPDGLALCAGCHQLSPGDGTDYAGPSLVGVMGRKIASAPGYAFSDSLQDVDGVWTEEALIKFLGDPQRFAPGGTMPALDLGGNDMRFAIDGLRRISAEAER